MTLREQAVLADKWRIEGVLGEGGMGVVYAATHVRNGARVAVKLLHQDIARDEATRQRFLQEGYIANRVDHPGVVKVLDDGTTEEGQPFLVMERLVGEPLDALAERAGGALPLPEVLRHGARLLEVVAKAHARGIVHRDLKPENVFLCQSGEVKVLDFGIAQVRETVSNKRLTTTGVPLGTPAFMPPEQALAHWEEVDARSDVYAIGATLFTLLTGRLVHEGRTIPELLVAVSTRPARPIRQVAPDIPGEVALVIDRALSFRPQDRFAHGADMLAGWQVAMMVGRITVGAVPPGEAATFDADATVALGTTTLSESAVTERTAPPAARRPPAPLRWIVAIVVLGVAGSVGAYFAWRRAGTDDWEPDAQASSAPSAVAAPTDAPTAALTAEEPTVSFALTATASASPSAAASTPTATASTATARPTARPLPPGTAKPPVTSAPAERPCQRDQFTGRCPCARCVD